jgi:CxxC-x17-CxxC domain-containing protein
MEKFTRGDRGSFRNGGGKGGFKGGFKGGWKGRDERGGESRPVVLHKAICSSCSKPCEVPFRPTGEKPVYCRDCFAGRAAMGGDRSQRKDYRGESTLTPAKNTVVPQKSFVNDDLKKQIDSMNIKLDKLMASITELVEKM